MWYGWRFQTYSRICGIFFNARVEAANLFSIVWILTTRTRKCIHNRALVFCGRSVFTWYQTVNSVVFQFIINLHGRFMLRLTLCANLRNSWVRFWPRQGRWIQPFLMLSRGSVMALVWLACDNEGLNVLISFCDCWGCELEMWEYWPVCVDLWKIVVPSEVI